MAGLFPYLSSALAWLVSWYVDQHLYFLQFATGVSLVFLPSGIRTLAVFAFGIRGAAGIFLGNLFTANIYFAGDKSISELGVLTICFVSAFSAYVVMEAVCWWKKIPSDLSSLKFKHVLYIVVSQGFLSASLHKIIFYIENVDGLQQANQATVVVNWLAMSLGDITGSMIVLTGVWSVFSFMRKAQQS